MIILLTSTGKGHTWRDIVKWPQMPRLKRWSYWNIFRRPIIPRATYIFSDFCRLGPWELELASHLYRFLQSAGMTVLNDPARFKNRYSLLTSLNNAGINDFRVWCPALDEKPDKFPVFLRTQVAHRGPIGDLLQNPQEAQVALEKALAEGYIYADLIFVEYAAQPLPDDTFRKLSAHRIKDQVFMAPGGFSNHWLAKAHDEIGDGPHWPMALHDLEQNIHEEVIRQAFDIANLQYGRADFGLVDGKPQIYEINSNPIIGDIKRVGTPQFQKAYNLRAEKFTTALRKIDTADSLRHVILDDDLFLSQRRKDWPSLGFHRALR